MARENNFRGSTGLELGVNLGLGLGNGFPDRLHINTDIGIINLPFTPGDESDDSPEDPFGLRVDVRLSTSF